MTKSTENLTINTHLLMGASIIMATRSRDLLQIPWYLKSPPLSLSSLLSSLDRVDYLTTTMPFTAQQVWITPTYLPTSWKPHSLTHSLTLSTCATSPASEVATASMAPLGRAVPSISRALLHQQYNLQTMGLAGKKYSILRGSSARTSPPTSGAFWQSARGKTVKV